MVKHLYLMRHGETLFNVRRKIQGWCDSPLTENGVKQAKAVREILKDIQFDHYYSSTAERCCDTLEIVTDYKVEYKRLKQLKSYGYHFCCRDYFRKLIKEYIDDDLDSLKGFFYKWHRANYSWLFGDLDDSDGTWFTRIRNGSIGAEIHDSGVVDVGQFYPFFHNTL